MGKILSVFNGFKNNNLSGTAPSFTPENVPLSVLEELLIAKRQIRYSFEDTIEHLENAFEQADQQAKDKIQDIITLVKRKDTLLAQDHLEHLILMHQIGKVGDYITQESVEAMESVERADNYKCPFCYGDPEGMDCSNCDGNGWIYIGWRETLGCGHCDGTGKQPCQRWQCKSKIARDERLKGNMDETVVSENDAQGPTGKYGDGQVATHDNYKKPARNHFKNDIAGEKYSDEDINDHDLTVDDQLEQEHIEESEAGKCLQCGGKTLTSRLELCDPCYKKWYDKSIDNANQRRRATDRVMPIEETIDVYSKLAKRKLKGKCISCGNEPCTCKTKGKLRNRKNFGKNEWREPRVDADVETIKNQLFKKKKVWESMNLVGQKKPISVVAKNGLFYIEDGNHRYFAAKKLGWQTIQTEDLYSGEIIDVSLDKLVPASDDQIPSIIQKIAEGESMKNISEGDSISVNTSYDSEQGENSITVTAHNQKADELEDILKLSGMLPQDDKTVEAEIAPVPNPAGAVIEDIVPEYNGSDDEWNAQNKVDSEFGNAIDNDLQDEDWTEGNEEDADFGNLVDDELEGVGTCKECGEEANSIIRGLCTACFQALRHDAPAPMDDREDLDIQNFDNDIEVGDFTESKVNEGHIYDLDTKVCANCGAPREEGINSNADDEKLCADCYKYTHDAGIDLSYDSSQDSEPDDFETYNQNEADDYRDEFESVNKDGKVLKEASGYYITGHYAQRRDHYVRIYIKMNYDRNPGENPEFVRVLDKSQATIFDDANEAKKIAADAKQKFMMYGLQIVPVLNDKSISESKKKNNKHDKGDGRCYNCGIQTPKNGNTPSRVICGRCANSVREGIDELLKLSGKEETKMNESLTPERRKEGLNGAAHGWSNEPNEQIAGWRALIQDTDGLSQPHDMFNPVKGSDNILTVAKNKKEEKLHEDAGINAIAEKLQKKFSALKEEDKPFRSKGDKEVIATEGKEKLPEKTKCNTCGHTMWNHGSYGCMFGDDTSKNGEPTCKCKNFIAPKKVNEWATPPATEPPAVVRPATSGEVRPALKFPMKVSAKTASGEVKPALNSVNPEKGSIPSSDEVKDAWGISPLYKGLTWQLDDAVKESTLKEDFCVSCDKRIKTGSDIDQCPTCYKKDHPEGKGKKKVDEDVKKKTCNLCDGSGKEGKVTCSHCNGKGVVTMNTKLSPLKKVTNESDTYLSSARDAMLYAEAEMDHVFANPKSSTKERDAATEDFEDAKSDYDEAKKGNVNEERVAATVAKKKNDHPEDYCKVKGCLWRTKDKPCEKHKPAVKEGIQFKTESGDDYIAPNQKALNAYHKAVDDGDWDKVQHFEETWTSCDSIKAKNAAKKKVKEDTMKPKDVLEAINKSKAKKLGDLVDSLGKKVKKLSAPPSAKTKISQSLERFTDKLEAVKTSLKGKHEESEESDEPKKGSDDKSENLTKSDDKPKKSFGKSDDKPAKKDKEASEEGKEAEPKPEGQKETKSDEPKTNGGDSAAVGKVKDIGKGIYESEGSLLRSYSDIIADADTE